MKKTSGAAAALTVIILLFFSSCASGLRLDAMATHDDEVSGTYSLILYGCGFNGDFQTIAFLDNEADQYTIVPYTHKFNYRVIEDMSGPKALEKATEFLHCNSAFRTTKVRKIVGPDGRTLGYEIRPLYHSYAYGSGDALHTDYRLQDRTVIVHVSLAPWVDRMLMGGGGHRDD